MILNPLKLTFFSPLSSPNVPKLR